jgi:hypothetical protein
MCRRFRGRQRGRKVFCSLDRDRSYSSTRKEGKYLGVLVGFSLGDGQTYGRVMTRSSSLLRFFHVMESSGDIPGIMKPANAV